MSLCCSTAIQENSPALLNAICFTAATHEAAARIGSKSPVDMLSSSQSLDSPQQQALRYKAIALQSLTLMLEHNNNSITEATILCVAVLLIAAAIFGDRVALTAHIHGLKHMLALLGGENQLSQPVSTHIQLASLKACLFQRAKPLCKLSLYVKSRFNVLSRQIFQPEAAAVLGSGIWSCQSPSQISPAIQDCARCMAHLILIIERDKATRKKSNTLTIDDIMALEHVLISMPHQYALSELDECIRLALLLYSNISIWKTPLPFAWVVSLVNGLKTALLSLSWDGVVKDHAQLLFWILLMGRHAASVGHSEEETMWWSIKLQCIVSSLQISQWEEAQQILEQFFFVDDVCGRSWKVVWKTLLGKSKEGDEKAFQEFQHPCSYHS